jgi:hypothetical protein
MQGFYALYSWCSGRLSLLGFVLVLEAFFVINKQGLETRTRGFLAIMRHRDSKSPI